MNNKRVHEIVEYMKKHPVNGFDLAIVSDSNENGSTPSDDSPTAALIYRKAGIESEDKDIIVFIGESDGLIYYRTVFPVYKETKRRFVENAYLLMGDTLAVSDGGFRMCVNKHSVMGMNGYIVDFESINKERLNPNEHKLISTILWGTLAIHFLGQQC